MKDTSSTVLVVLFLLLLLDAVTGACSGPLEDFRSVSTANDLPLNERNGEISLRPPLGYLLAVLRK